MLKKPNCIAFVILIIVAGFFIISCTLENYESSDYIAGEMADSIANPENGMVAQLNDVVNLFSGDSKSVPSRSTVIISTENGELTGFNWNGENEQYERTGSNLDININDVLTGTINTFAATCKFFASTDTSGTGVQVNPDGTIPGDVHSMIHTRDIDTSLTNINRNVNREIVIDADYTITGINDTAGGVTISGTRISTGETTGPNFTGGWIKTINFTDIFVIREKNGNTTTYTYIGNAMINFIGTYMNTNGNTREIVETATVSFNGTKNVTVTISGSTITIDITSGEIV